MGRLLPQEPRVNDMMPVTLDIRKAEAALRLSQVPSTNTLINLVMPMHKISHFLIINIS